jgi:hypothetical protein
VVRTFAQADFQFSNFASTGLGYGATLFPGGTNGQVNNDTVGNGYVAVEMAFIQWAGFTFGKSASAFNTPWHGYPGNNTSFLVGGYDTVTGINNVQYSWQFGNGVSATLGIDESSASQFNRTQIINAVGGAAIATPGLGVGAFAGNRVVRSASAVPARRSTRRLAVPMAERLCLTSSATSASIRPGVCSRCLARSTTTMLATLRARTRSRLR